MKKPQIFFVFFVSVIIVLYFGFFLGQNLDLSSSNNLISPFISQEKKNPLPYLKFTIPNLATYNYQASPEIKIEKILSQTPDHTSYLFSYTTTGKKMTGQINIPSLATQDDLSSDTTFSTIIMLRGWAPAESYTTGTGTKNAAAILANNGYVTIAPDFFGYGESDSESEDSWETRFTKPVNIIELIKTIQENPQISFQHLSDLDKKKVPASLNDISLNKNKIGIWAHSNGGQIALTTLEVINQTNIISQPIPTTLWAPVTAPFPYSLLFFSDENEDEGKASRKWISIFEESYDVFDFSLTKHLNLLTGPIQLHHGTADEAALVAWSDEFVEKVKVDNKRRGNLSMEYQNIVSSEGSGSATKSNENNPKLLEPVDITYFTYPEADHNLQPGWNTVVKRDVEFFEKYL